MNTDIGYIAWFTGLILGGLFLIGAMYHYRHTNEGSDLLGINIVISSLMILIGISMLVRRFL